MRSADYGSSVIDDTVAIDYKIISITFFHRIAAIFSRPGFSLWCHLFYRFIEIENYLRNSIIFFLFFHDRFKSSIEKHLQWNDIVESQIHLF